MTQEELEKYMMRLLDSTEMPEEEKEDCVNRFPGYLVEVVLKHINRTDVTDQGEHVHTAILGFIGGYTARHLYAYHKKMKLEKGHE